MRLLGALDIQGATVWPVLVLYFCPAYLKCRALTHDFATYAKRTTRRRPSPTNGIPSTTGLTLAKFSVSLQKAMFGDADPKQNELAFLYLPKSTENYSWTQIWTRCPAGTSKECSPRDESG